MNMKKLPLASLLALGALSSACSVGDSTRGDLGRVDFSYGASCFFGCGTDQPVLSESSERIDVTGPGNAEGVSAISLDPATAEIAVRRSCGCEKQISASEAEGTTLPESGVCPEGFDEVCDNAFDLTTHAAGNVKIELRDAAGDLVDSTTLHVRSADRLELTQLQEGTADETPVSALEVPLGESVELRATAYASDEKLLGADGFAWKSAEPSIAAVHSGSPVASVTAKAAGSTTITVVAGETSIELPIVVN